MSIVPDNLIMENVKKRRKENDIKFKSPSMNTSIKEQRKGGRQIAKKVDMSRVCLKNKTTIATTFLVTC